MKKMLVIALFIFMALSNIEAKADVPENTPACVKAKIEQLKGREAENPGWEVREYEYNGKTVYFIPMQCCDMYSTLMDSQCNHLCGPDGGITGRGDGKCPDFHDKAKLRRTIWKDPRPPR